MRVFTNRRARSALVWGAALAAWSCGTATNDATTNEVASVVVTPGTVTLTVGQQQPVQAAVNDGGGRPVSGAVVVWSVRDRNIVFVSPTGVVTALAVGVTEVAASASGKSGIAAVIVQRAPVASVVVLPLHVDAFAGVRTTFNAVAYDANGLQLSGRPFSWTSSSTTVATVDVAGSVTAVAPGNATITATSEGKSNTATITVAVTPVVSVTVAPSVISLAPGQSAQFSATARDGAGNVITGRPTQWSSSNLGVATVSTTGTVTGVADGSALITAVVGGVATTASVIISSTPVGSVTVQPSTATINQNATQQLSATVRDVDNVILPRPVTWTTSNAGIATVTTNGLVTGVTPGDVTITATSDGISGTARVTVNRAPVAAVTVP